MTEYSNVIHYTYPRGVYPEEDRALCDDKILVTHDEVAYYRCETCKSCIHKHENLSWVVGWLSFVVYFVIIHKEYREEHDRIIRMTERVEYGRASAMDITECYLRFLTITFFFLIWVIPTIFINLLVYGGRP